MAPNDSMSAQAARARRARGDRRRARRRDERLGHRQRVRPAGKFPWEVGPEDGRPRHPRRDAGHPSAGADQRRPDLRPTHAPAHFKVRRGSARVAAARPRARAPVKRRLCAHRALDRRRRGPLFFLVVRSRRPPRPPRASSRPRAGVRLRRLAAKLSSGGRSEARARRAWTRGPRANQSELPSRPAPTMQAWRGARAVVLGRRPGCRRPTPLSIF